MKNQFELKKTEAGYHFNYIGDIQVLSSESYVSKSGALNGIESVKENSSNIDNYDLRVSKDNKDYFVLIAQNHEIIGTSIMYSNKSEMQKDILDMIEYTKQAPTYELGIDEYKEK